MAVLQTMNPLAASFLVQLNIELEGTGIEARPDDARFQPRFAVRTVRPAPSFGSTFIAAKIY